MKRDIWTPIILFAIIFGIGVVAMTTSESDYGSLDGAGRVAMTPVYLLVQAIGNVPAGLLLIAGAVAAGLLAYYRPWKKPDAEG